MTLINTTSELAAAAKRLRTEPYITIDTEFMRERTYWAKLCLVQLAGRDEAVAVDTLAPGIDLAPLLDLLADKAVLKVFHACRQDLEIFLRLMGGSLPEPVFDTQIAAMVCGFGEEVAYETLVSRLAKARLDKSSRFTDWSRRPLSEAQLAYALADVTHLRVIYEKLKRRIEEGGRMPWVEEETRYLLDPRLYVTEPEDAWQRLKVRSREPRFIALVQHLAAWRERKAQARDLPRNRVVRDDLLLELAAQKPRDQEALRRLDRINLDKESMREVVGVIEGVFAIPEAELPRLPEPKPPVKGLGPTVDLLRVLLKQCADESDVAQRLIATAADLEALAQDDAADVPALHGWRRELFGDKALELKAGRIALALENQQVVVLELEDED
jgi:ribonuclease D